MRVHTLLDNCLNENYSEFGTYSDAELNYLQVTIRCLLNRMIGVLKRGSTNTVTYHSRSTNRTNYEDDS